MGVTKLLSFLEVFDAISFLALQALGQCLNGQKEEGIKNLQKAKELGDTQAEGLIEKYK